jgi:hypothetical protein
LDLLEKPLTVEALRGKLGPVWESRSQPLFDLVAAGYVKIAMPNNVSWKPVAEGARGAVPPGFGETLKTISVALPLPKRRTSNKEPEKKGFLSKLFGG